MPHHPGYARPSPAVNAVTLPPPVVPTNPPFLPNTRAPSRRTTPHEALALPAILPVVVGPVPDVASLDTHDPSSLRVGRITPAACTACVCPCNADGLTLSASGERYEYDASCRSRDALIDVR